MKKKHLKILKEIQERLPREMLESLMKKEKQFSTLKEVLERALQEPDEKVSPKKKKAYRAILASGILEKEVDVVDPDIEKLIDEFYTVEIKKEVDAGRLPAQPEKLQLLNNKGVQYERRNAKRLKKLFGGADNEVPDEEEDDQGDEEGDSPRGSDDSVLREGRGGSDQGGGEGEGGEDRNEGGTTH